MLISLSRAYVRRMEVEARMLANALAGADGSQQPARQAKRVPPDAMLKLMGVKLE